MVRFTSNRRFHGTLTSNSTMMTDTALQATTDRNDQMLVAALEAHGVRHLSVAEAVIAYDAVIDIPDLIARLANDTDLVSALR